MNIGRDLLVETATSRCGNELHIASLRYVPEGAPEDDGGVTLDRREVEQLREACDEFLAGRRV